MTSRTRKLTVGVAVVAVVVLIAEPGCCSEHAG
jgi:hypothetical protein